MSEQEPHEGDIFDVERIRRLVALMEEHDLGEVDLKQSDQRIRIRRGAAPLVSGPVVAGPPAAAPASAPPAAAAGGKAEVADGTFIKSPMVGTFYQSANPDSEPFVRVGDVIGVDTTVCIIEAMKVFNEIPAECSGKIVAILIENGEPVEYGQPLFKLDTNP